MSDARPVTVGIDIGTSSVKAVAADDDGNVVARARIPHDFSVPSPQRFQHDARVAWHDGPTRALEQGYGEEKWMDWTTSTVGAPITTIFWQLIRTPAEKRDMAAVEAALKQAADVFKIADDALAAQPYLGGKSFSMADIPFGCFANRWLQLPVERPDHPNLARYYDRLKARPAFQQAYYKGTRMSETFPLSPAIVD